jgi:hypothetical protein
MIQMKHNAIALRLVPNKYAASAPTHRRGFGKYPAYKLFSDPQPRGVQSSIPRVEIDATEPWLRSKVRDKYTANQIQSYCLGCLESVQHNFHRDRLEISIAQRKCWGLGCRSGCTQSSQDGYKRSRNLESRIGDH